eukprot:194832-Chlamydomonas_euryale.AAC.2
MVRRAVPHAMLKQPQISQSLYSRTHARAENLPPAFAIAPPSTISAAASAPLKNELLPCLLCKLHAHCLSQMRPKMQLSA